MKKSANIALWIFAVGATLCLFAGALAFFGFIAAFVIGGDTATKICVFIHKQYFPYVIVATSVSALFGLLGMYLKNVKALSLKKEENKF